MYKPLDGRFHRIEPAGINAFQKAAQTEQGFFEGIFGNEFVIAGGYEFVDIYNFDKTVGINDNVGEKVRKDISICFGLIVVLYDIAVPIEQRIVFSVKFADFAVFFQKIAGIAVMKVFSGL